MQVNKYMLIWGVFAVVLLSGCASRRTVSRDFILVYDGPNAPGPNWKKIESGSGWERHAKLNVNESHTLSGMTCSIPLNQIPESPLPVFIGPVSPGARIGYGATIGNIPTSSGPTIMLLAPPSKTVLEWKE